MEYLSPEPSAQGRQRPAAAGPEEGHKNNQRGETPLWKGQKRGD